jgi:hypothetical protein
VWIAKKIWKAVAMSDPEENYVLIESALGGEFKRDGIEVEVHIYRSEEDPLWVLEVVDQGNNSFVWDERFATDHAAMSEFLASVEREGMKQYNPHYRRDLH